MLFQNITCGTSKMVELLTRSNKIQGSNPAAGNKKEKIMWKNIHHGASTMVEHSTPSLKIKGSNPATSNQRE